MCWRMVDCHRRLVRWDWGFAAQKGADDLLDVLLLVLGEGSGGVDGFGVLDHCSVSGDSVLVGLVLGFVGRLVSKSQECFFDVSGHAQVYVSVLVVPIEG